MLKFLTSDCKQRWICFFLIMLLAISLSGCCGRKKQKVSKSKGRIDMTDSLKKLGNKSKNKNTAKASAKKVEDIAVDLAGQLPLREKDQQTKELYENLERANDLYKMRNYEGALRELDRIQRESADDPYLEMQAWALSATVYDKTGKTSRRKRAYRKMFDALVAVHKDPRYEKARQDGKECMELIKIAKEKGDEKYATE